MGEPIRPDSRAGVAVPPPEDLPVEEVMRRLRALGEPATLFGETEEQRFQRMLLAEQNVAVRGRASLCRPSATSQPATSRFTPCLPACSLDQRMHGA